MADNTTLNAGAGGNVAATDDCAGVHYQYVKLADGTADSTAKIAGDATNGLDVDVTRVIPGTSATHLGKAEDVASAGGDTGVTVLSVRQDSITGDTSTDGDYQFVKSDSVGRLYVNASGAAVPVTDNAGSLTVDGTVTVQDGGGAISVDDNGGSLTVDGTVAISGTVAVTDNAGSLTVDNGGTFAVQATIAAGVASIAKAEDVASNDADVGVPAMAVRKATPANTSGSDGDYEFLQMSAGRLWASATIDAAIPAGNNNIGDVDIASIAAGNNNIGDVDIASMPNVTLAAGTNTNEVVGDVAHDAAAAGNPVLIGGYATNNIEGITQVANADAARVLTDLNGCVVTRPYTTPDEILSERIADTGGTSTAFSTFAAGGAGIRNYVSSITIWNSSATDGFVDIRDGAAGAVLATFPAPQTGGGHFALPVPLKGSANTALAYDVSGAITTVYITVIGYQAK